MWYVISVTVPGTRSYYGAYKSESEADAVAEKVNGVAIMVKDWQKYAEIMNGSVLKS